MAENIDIHTLNGTKEQVLYVLYENQNKTLKPKDICNALVSKYKISISPKEVQSLLHPKSNLINQGLVHKHGKGQYEIMQKGVDLLSESVVYINPEKEQSIVQSIRKVFKKLSGKVRIFDPYLDVTALQKLNTWTHDGIKNLYLITENKRSLKKSDLNNLENIQSVEIKIQRKIHDRYIFDDKNLFCIGTSLNCIGNKHSYIFHLNNLLPYFKKEFEKMWDKGDDI